jgi:hypothetical protein
VNIQQFESPRMGGSLWAHSSVSRWQMWTLIKKKMK